MSLRVKHKLPIVSRKPLAQRTLKRERRRQLVRRTFVALACLVVLTAGAGFAYTWVMGQQTPALAKNPTRPNSKNILTSPPKIASNAPIGASVQSLTSPVAPGDNASIIIRTNQAANCSILVEYNDIPAQDSGLKPKLADEYGTVSWGWTVASDTPIGTWPVTVNCKNKTNSAEVRGDLIVK